MPRVCIVLVALGAVAAFGPAAAQPPNPPDLLAEGPDDVTIGRWIELRKELRVEKGTLLFLRTNKLYFRPEGQGRSVQEIDPKGARWIETKDKQYRWEADLAKGVFKGRPKPIEPIDLTPLPAAKKNERLMLFAALEQIYRAMKNPFLLDEEKVTAFQEAAQRYAKYLPTEPPSPTPKGKTKAKPKAAAPGDDLRQLCEGVNTLAAEWRRFSTELEETARKLKRERVQLIRDLREAQIEENLDVLKRVDTSSIEGLIISSVAASAVSNYRQAELSRLGNRLNLEIEQRAQQRLIQILSDYNRAWNGRWDALGRVGSSEFGRPPAQGDDKLLEQLLKGDWEGISKYYTQLAQQEPNNPFRQADRCFWAAMVPARDNRERARNMLAQAKECAKAVRLVPAGTVHDRARLFVLAQACLIAYYAAEAECEGEGWAKAHSPTAAYAVRLVDKYNEFSHIFELTGLLREYRAWALALSGRTDEALDQALRLQDLRQNTPLFGFNLARVYSLKGETKSAMKWLDQAVKVGKFVNIREMIANPDLRAVRAKEKRAFDELIRVLPGWDVLPPVSMRLTNQSAFAWTNVSVKVRVNGGAGTLNYAERIPRIEPQRSVVLNGIFQGIAVRKIDAVIVECDQNRKK